MFSSKTSSKGSCDTEDWMMLKTDTHSNEKQSVCMIFFFLLHLKRDKYFKTFLFVNTQAKPLWTIISELKPDKIIFIHVFYSGH